MEHEQSLLPCIPAPDPSQENNNSFTQTGDSAARDLARGPVYNLFALTSLRTTNANDSCTRPVGLVDGVCLGRVELAGLPWADRRRTQRRVPGAAPLERIRA